jgi:hypothetical protein
MRPAASVASLSMDAFERSPWVETRAANSTSASDALDFTRSTVMSLRKRTSGVLASSLTSSSLSADAQSPAVATLAWMQE